MVQCAVGMKALKPLHTHCMGDGGVQYVVVECEATVMQQQLGGVCGGSVCRDDFPC